MKDNEDLFAKSDAPFYLQSQLTRYKQLLIYDF